MKFALYTIAAAAFASVALAVPTPAGPPVPAESLPSYRWTPDTPLVSFQDFIAANPDHPLAKGMGKDASSLGKRAGNIGNSGIRSLDCDVLTLDVQNANYVNGQQILQYDVIPQGPENQRWNILTSNNGNSWIVQSVHDTNGGGGSGWCIDYNSDADLSHPRLWSCNGSGPQAWYLKQIIQGGSWQFCNVANKNCLQLDSNGCQGAQLKMGTPKTERQQAFYFLQY